MTITGLDHARLSMPAGGLGRARAFYVDLLHLTPVGGEGGECLRVRAGGAELWLTPDAPALPGSVALRTSNLDGMRAMLRAVGVGVRDLPDEGGARRAEVDDPFGNRVILVEPAGD